MLESVLARLVPPNVSLTFCAANVIAPSSGRRVLLQAQSAAVDRRAAGVGVGGTQIDVSGTIGVDVARPGVGAGAAGAGLVRDDAVDLDRGVGAGRKISRLVALQEDAGAEARTTPAVIARTAAHGAGVDAGAAVDVEGSALLHEDIAAGA